MLEAPARRSARRTRHYGEPERDQPSACPRERGDRPSPRARPGADRTAETLAGRGERAGQNHDRRRDPANAPGPSSRGLNEPADRDAERGQARYPDDRADRPGRSQPGGSSGDHENRHPADGGAHKGPDHEAVFELRAHEVSARDRRGQNEGEARRREGHRSLPAAEPGRVEDDDEEHRRAEHEQAVNADAGTDQTRDRAAYEHADDRAADDGRVHLVGARAERAPVDPYEPPRRVGALPRLADHPAHTSPYSRMTGPSTISS